MVTDRDGRRRVRVTSPLGSAAGRARASAPEGTRPREGRARRTSRRLGRRFSRSPCSVLAKHPNHGAPVPAPAQRRDAIVVELVRDLPLRPTRIGHPDDPAPHSCRHPLLPGG